jgi:hypothetical protein
MIDSDVLELVPHLVAMVVLIALVIGSVRLLLGSSSFWVGPIAALVISFLYPFWVRRLGVAPERWE